MTGFTGTVVSHLSLGLPQLPDLGTTGDGTSLPSLLTGSHTMQVWYGGITKQRIALLGTTDENDLFRDGRQLWEWDSANRSAVHTVLPNAAQSAPSAAPTSAAASLTPEQLAKRLLDKMDPTTKVQVKGHGSVADRSTYEVVLTPRSRTRIGSVHIAIDGQTKMPLAVRVYARGASHPAIDVGFTSISYGTPSQRNFAFRPPPGAHVRTVHHHSPHHGTSTGGHSTSRSATRPSDVHVLGSGWARVLTARVPQTWVHNADRSPVLQALTPVNGTWGTGRLLDSSLVTVLITNDGRVFTGAVDPSVLYAAAGTK